MNKIDEFTENKLREMVRSGYSQRQMASKAGVSRKVAVRASMEYRHEAPLCQHDKPIYECSSCFGRRRTVSQTRDIIWLRMGPAKRKHLTGHGLSAEELLITAMNGVLTEESSHEN